MHSKSNLLELQRQFYNTLRTNGLNQKNNLPENLSCQLTGTDQFSVEQRVEVYSRSYVWRIVDAVWCDFEKLVAFIGANEYRKVLLDFVAAVPSRAFNIVELSRPFVDFFCSHVMGLENPYLADIVRMQMLIIESRYSETELQLSPQHIKMLSEFAPDQLKLKINPSLRFLFSQWPIAEIYRSEMPAEKKDTCVMIASGERKSKYYDADPIEVKMLNMAQMGESFYKVIQVGLEHSLSEEQTGSFFTQWAARNFIVGIDKI